MERETSVVIVTKKGITLYETVLNEGDEIMIRETEEDK